MCVCFFWRREGHGDGGCVRFCFGGCVCPGVCWWEVLFFLLRELLYQYRFGLVLLVFYFCGVKVKEAGHTCGPTPKQDYGLVVEGWLGRVSTTLHLHTIC